MGRLTGKSAIITGAGRGIGKEIARRFAAEGASLLLVTVSTPLDPLINELRDRGVTVEGLAGDVGDQVFAKEVVDRCVSRFGGVDILVNNAGITRDNLLMRMKEEDFDEVIRVNLKGAYLLCQAVVKPMMKQRAGSIINLTSVVGLTGNAGQANYAASKAGVIGLTKSVAKELGSRSIRANAIAPGFIETDMTHEMTDGAKEATLGAIPLRRLGQASEIASAALFLASDEASYISGHTLVVDGGLAM
jgi:3-oxoacyl-[acyl-carrier protein] reductase